MSEIPAIPRAGPPRDPGWHHAWTVLGFTVIGPLVGAAAITMLIVLFGFRPIDPRAASLFPFVVTLAYPLGIIPAFVTGLIVAVRDYYVGTKLGEALLIGLALAGLAGVVLGSLTVLCLIIALSGVAATAVCWKLTRWKRRPA